MPDVIRHESKVAVYLPKTQNSESSTDSSVNTLKLVVGRNSQIRCEGLK